MSLWERFENIVSANEVNDAKAQFTPIQAGDYQAVLESIEPAESKQGLPMLKGKFRTIEGNRILFYNQMLQNLNNPNMTAINVAEAVTFVGGLLGEEVEFQGLGHLAGLIESIPTGGEFTVNVSYGTKDLEMKFPKLKIKVPVEAFEDSFTGFGDGETTF